MNTLQNNPISSILSNEDDARAIEDVIRATVKAVLNVFRTINNKKMQEYERSVAEKDRENEMLRIRMESVEMELVTLRQSKHSAAQCGDILTSDTDNTHGRESCLSTEENGKQCVCVVPFLHDQDNEALSEGAWKREIMTGPYQGTFPGAHLQGREATACSWGSPGVVGLNHEVPSERAASSITLEDQPGGQPEYDGTVTITKVKEEPPDFQSLYIKWEMSEQSVRRAECEHYPGASPFAPLSQYPRGDSLAAGTLNLSSGLSEQTGLAALATCQRKRLSNRERQKKYRERIRADPEKQRAYREKDRNRHRNRRKLICDLPEDFQKLKREAWREAARRHRDRKKNSASR